MVLPTGDAPYRRSNSGRWSQREQWCLFLRGPLVWHHSRDQEGMPPDPRLPAGPQSLSKGSGLPWSSENSDWLSCLCKSGLEALKHFNGGPMSKLTRPVKNIPGERELMVNVVCT